MPSLDMLCKQLKDRLTVKLAIFQMAEEDCGLHLSDLRDKSNDSSVADRLSIVTSGRIEPLPPLIFERCKHSKQSICLSQNDLLILLALFWCRINPSFLTESRVRPWRSPLCLHFWRRPGYIACREMTCRKMSPMHVTLKAGVSCKCFPLCVVRPIRVRRGVICL